MIAAVEHEGVLWLTLDRPARRNALTEPMLHELRKLLRAHATRPQTRCIILGARGSAFCAGQDLGAVPHDVGALLKEAYAPLLNQIAQQPQPVIAAVNGAAAGAGAGLALACDLVVAAKSAQFSLPFARLGLVPDAGTSWLVPRLAGQARAMGMALLGASVNAVQAQDWGLVWEVVEDEALATRVAAVAQKIASAAPDAIAATKALIRSPLSQSFGAQLEREAAAQSRASRSDAYREGIAAFIEKRPPVF